MVKFIVIEKQIIKVISYDFILLCGVFYRLKIEKLGYDKYKF